MAGACVPPRPVGLESSGIRTRTSTRTHTARLARCETLETRAITPPCDPSAPECEACACVRRDSKSRRLWGQAGERRGWPGGGQAARTFSFVSCEGLVRCESPQHCPWYHSWMPSCEVPCGVECECSGRSESRAGGTFVKTQKSPFRPPLSASSPQEWVVGGRNGGRCFVSMRSHPHERRGAHSASCPVALLPSPPQAPSSPVTTSTSRRALPPPHGNPRRIGESAGGRAPGWRQRGAWFCGATHGVARNRQVLHISWMGCVFARERRTVIMYCALYSRIVLFLRRKRRFVTAENRSVWPAIPIRWLQ